jgi:hypothetical protein
MNSDNNKMNSCKTFPPVSDEGTNDMQPISPLACLLISSSLHNTSIDEIDEMINGSNSSIDMINVYSTPINSNNGPPLPKIIRDQKAIPTIISNCNTVHIELI